MRYFLLGAYGIDLFFKDDYKSLVQNKNKWELISYSLHRDDITELIEHVIGWDAYLELGEFQVKAVNDAIEFAEKQERDFDKQFHAYMKQQIKNDFERSLGLSF